MQQAANSISDEDAPASYNAALSNNKVVATIHEVIYFTKILWSNSFQK
jgi:hypothetical protein